MRRYRRPPLSDHAKAAYRRVHYALSKQEFSDHLADMYWFCHEQRLPFVCIIQPRRFCTLEIDLDPAGVRMSETAQAVIKVWAENALDFANAPRKSKSVAVSDTGAVIRGLDFELAKQLADRIWTFIESVETEVTP